MLSFAHPWLFVLLPLPILVWLGLPAYVDRRVALRVPFFERLARLAGVHAGQRVVAPRGVLRLGVLVTCWALTIAALVRPQWIEPPLHREQPTRDLLLLVDLSGSMDTEDFPDPPGRKIQRLAAVKQVLGDFLERRKGDRVGVVVFGDAPFLLVPFTTDLKLARTLLDETVVAMAGPRTAFGDAIGLGIGLFDRSIVKARTIVALTDGNDTASKVPPVEAAEVAKDKGIVIHTVAIGDPAAVGEDKLDEKALQDVAHATGGESFRAMDRGQLENVYGQLDRIEARKIDVVSYRPKRDIYWMPLGAALALSLLAQGGFLLAGWWSGRAPSSRQRAPEGAAEIRP